MAKLLFLYIIIALLAGVAICNFADISIDDIWRKVTKLADNRTLAQKTATIGGKVPKGFFSRQNYNTEMVLKAMGKEGNVAFIRLVSVAGFIIGILVAIVLENYILAPLLGIVFWFIPRVAVNIYVQRFKQRLNYELETALRIITSSYKNTGNLVVTVEESISMINPPVKAYFQMFLNEMKSIDPSIVSALNRMKARIPNRIFYEWVNAMIQCQSDKSLIPRLDDVLENFENEHLANARLKTEVAPAQVMVYVMAAFSVGLTIFIGSQSPSWADVLLHSTVGKIAVAALVFIDIFAIYKTYRLGDPIEYTSMEDHNK